MSLKYTSQEKPKLGYAVKIEYEHGDADATTYGNIHIESEEKFNHFLKVFREMTDDLDKYLSTRSDIPNEFYERAKLEKIPLERDIVLDEGVAFMTITQVVFTNEKGKSFNVDFKS